MPDDGVGRGSHDAINDAVGVRPYGLLQKGAGIGIVFLRHDKK
jgi:hypothetical protein